MRALAATVLMLAVALPAQAQPADDSAAAGQLSLEVMKRGLEAIAAGALDDGHTALQQAVTIHHGNHLAWYHLGQLHRRHDRHYPASAAFASAWRLRPDAAMYALWAGIGLEEDGKDGTPALLEAIRLEPRLFRAHWYLGHVHVRAGDDWRAATAWTAACRANPTFTAAFIDLARLYLRWDEYARAIEVLVQGRARASDPAARGDVELLLGQAYEGAGRPEEALAAYGRALALPGDRAAVRLHRGILLARLGRKAGARHDLKAYLGGGDGTPLERDLAEQTLLRVDLP